METSVAGGMCRCCASEGSFKDVKSSYTWMGEEEVYADMLRECFDVHLSSTSTGQYGGICEVCITQLRNAANFKKQVQQTEEQFKNLEGKFFTSNIVKLEVQHPEDGSQGDNSDDNQNEDTEGYSGNEYEIPIKSELAEDKPKKRARATTSRAGKKAKADEPDTSIKRTQPPMAKSDRELPQEDEDDLGEAVDEGTRQRYNIRSIILHTNATPIKKFGTIGYACCFCPEQFERPADLKEHTIAAHDDSVKSTFLSGRAMSNYLVKLDVTSLECNICLDSIEGMDDLESHLKEHDIELYTVEQNHTLPFRFIDNVELTCLYCSKEYNTFKALLEHMTHTHFRNYVCQICDAGFICSGHLKIHQTTHRTGVFYCAYCPKVFETMKKKTYHENHSHLKLMYRCGHCGEKFRTHDMKRVHLEAEHGIKPATMECKECGRLFRGPALLDKHIRRDHLMERPFECAICKKTFANVWQLKAHMMRHTGVKNFQCPICSKAFGTNRSLKHHIQLHTNDKPHKCDICDKAFIQRSHCNWHMKVKHGDVL